MFIRRHQHRDTKSPYSCLTKFFQDDELVVPGAPRPWLYCGGELEHAEQPVQPVPAGGCQL